MAAQSIDRIFWDAAQLATAGERDAYLDGACAGDEGLRRRIEQLLDARAKAEGFLEVPTADPWPTADALPAAEPAGAVIGPYRLLEQIGEGGFGVVYAAEQTEPVRRRVALKVLKPGMDTKQVVARFEAERQALALMDHPNIATVFDGGTTEQGLPYFVMELVKGAPITRYCDENHLSVRARLGLFADVCGAVQHAHQKGVIHRDVKPSNVLVTQHDGKAVVKVIDFGIAKAMGQQLTDKTLFTGLEQMVGTPLYMSPEQAGLSGLDVDTRSDVYSLGVLLYELLTGTTPFDRERLKEVGYDELRRIIREEEPPRPSTRVSTVGEAETASARRGSDPRRLSRMFRGELDWVAMKALEKDRTRRYESPGAFAADVQRYLSDEPVLACPPSVGYLFRKFLRRNRGPVLAAALVLLALVGGIAGTTAGLLRARASAERARASAGAERSARGEAQAKQAQAESSAAAEREARKAEAAERWKAREAEADTRAFADFLANDVLAAPRPQGWQLGVGANVTLAEALEKAGPKIPAAFAGRPKAEALARHHVGVTWRNLGRYAEAELHLRRALELRLAVLGPNHPDTLDTMNSLGVAFQQAGQPLRAVPLLEQALAGEKEKLGPDHPRTLMVGGNLAGAYRDAGRLDRALPLYERALVRLEATRGPDHDDTLTNLNNLASAYLAAGWLDRALPLLEQSLARHRKKLGPSHPDTLISMNELATAYREAGQPDRAVPLFEKALAGLQDKLGPEHPQALVILNNLALAHLAAGRPEKALRLSEQTLARTKKKLGPDHPQTLNTMNNLAWAHQRAGQLEKAQPLFEQALARMKEKLGPGDPLTLTCADNLAVVYWSLRKLDRSIPILKQTLRWREKNGGANPAKPFLTAFNLVVNYRDAGRLDEAVALCDRWLPRARTALKPGHPTRNFALQAAAAADGRAGRPDPLEPLLREQAEGVKQKDGADSLAYAAVLARLGMNLVLQHKPAEAEPPLRECLALRAKKQPDAWPTFNAESMLGGALLGQKKYAEAEPLLLRGYEGLKQREATVPKAAQARLTEALERLVQLYDGWGKQEKAAEWRERREAHRQAEKKAERPKEK